MKRTIIWTAALLLSLTSTLLSAQNQPSLMVIPYVKEGEDIRTILESDKAKRSAVAAVSASFTERNFAPIDFEAKLKASAKDVVFTSGQSQSDLQTQIIQNAGADIYVTVDVEIDKNSSGTDVKLILKAYESASGSLLSAKTSESGRFYSDDITKLAKRAIDSCVDDFLAIMQQAFVKMRSEGQAWIIQIEINHDSEKTFQSAVGTNGFTLADEIELWLESAAYQGKYRIAGSTDLLIKGTINLPHVDPNTGNPYNPARFRMSLIKFLTSLGVTSTGRNEGKTLYININ